MFVRLVESTAVTKPLLRNAWDHLNNELAVLPGWLGAAAGIARGNRFYASHRFESRAAADEAFATEKVSFWCEELERHIVDPETRQSDDAKILIHGDASRAGFVQLIMGRTSDRAGMEAVNAGMQEVMRAHRPDVLGSLIFWEGERFTEIVFFTSELEARAAESREFPGGLEGLFGELLQLTDDLEFVDLTDPWLAAPEPSPA